MCLLSTVMLLMLWIFLCEERLIFSSHQLSVINSKSRFNRFPTFLFLLKASSGDMLQCKHVKCLFKQYIIRKIISLGDEWFRLSIRICCFCKLHRFGSAYWWPNKILRLPFENFQFDNLVLLTILRIKTSKLSKLSNKRYFLSRITT